MIDRAIFDYLQANRTDFANHVSFILSDVTALFFIFLAFFISVMVLRRVSRLQVVVTVLFVIVFNTIVTESILKVILYRPRPFLVVPNVEVIGPAWFDGSFPSGHVSMITALGIVLLYYERKFLLPVIVFVILEGFSRVYNGLHWPSDTLGGVVFGIFYGLSSLKLARSAFVDDSPLVLPIFQRFLGGISRVEKKEGEGVRGDPE